MNKYDNEISSLFKVMDRVRKAWRSITPCDGLSKSQFGTLMAISHSQNLNKNHKFDNNSCISLTELANFMNQSNPALSQRIRTLEELGYVERVSDNNDRRISGIKLTDSGQKILNIAHLQFENIMSEVINNLGIEKTKTLINSLDNLADAFEKAIINEENEVKENEEN